MRTITKKGWVAVVRSHSGHRHIAVMSFRSTKSAARYALLEHAGDDAPARSLIDRSTFVRCTITTDQPRDSAEGEK